MEIGLFPALAVGFGVAAALAIAAVALGGRRNGFLLGLGAAAAAFAVTEIMWALSAPHHPWVTLIFQLFPAPSMDECARLIALFVAVERGMRAGPFSLGFAVFAALAAFCLDVLGGAPLLTLIAGPLLILALQSFLGLFGFALAKRKTAPFMIFCVLALIHGGHNGGLIALERVTDPITFVAVQALLMALYAGFCWLLRPGQIPAAAKIG